MEYEKDPLQDAPFDLDRGSELVPEGLQEFIVDAAEVKEGPKAAYILLTLRYAGPSPEFEGSAVWHNISLAPQSRWKLDEALDAIDAPATGKANSQIFMGKRVRAQIFHEEYECVMKAKVHQLVKSAFIGQPGQPTTPSAPGPSSPPEVKAKELSDDWDIPF